MTTTTVTSVRTQGLNPYAPVFVPTIMTFQEPVDEPTTPVTATHLVDFLSLAPDVRVVWKTAVEPLSLLQHIYTNIHTGTGMRFLAFATPRGRFDTGIHMQALDCCSLHSTPLPDPRQPTMQRI